MIIFTYTPLGNPGLTGENRALHQEAINPNTISKSGSACSR
jgi:hypothetical protein